MGYIFQNLAYNIYILHITYIYIYTVGGGGSPIGRQSGSLSLRKNSVLL